MMIRKFLFLWIADFFFNWQKYLIINAYFIDLQWVYHEVLLIFEHISSSHIKQKLTKVVQDVVVRHKLKKRLYTITNDNVVNNLIMHTKLNRLLCINRIFDEVDTNVHDVERVFYLAHVIQLVLQKLLSKIRIKSNADFKTSWDDKQIKTSIKNKKKKYHSHWRK